MIPWHIDSYFLFEFRCDFYLLEYQQFNVIVIAVVRHALTHKNHIAVGMNTWWSAPKHLSKIILPLTGIRRLRNVRYSLIQSMAVGVPGVPGRPVNMALENSRLMVILIHTPTLITKRYTVLSREGIMLDTWDNLRSNSFPDHRYLSMSDQRVQQSTSTAWWYRLYRSTRQSDQLYGSWRLDNLVSLVSLFSNLRLRYENT